MKQGKTRHLARIGACALALLLLCGTLSSCKGGSEVPHSAGLVLIEGVPVFDGDVAVKTDNFALTPGMLGYFFYTYGAPVMAQMEAQKPFDENKNLHGQAFNEAQSWYDVIMSETLARVCYMLICCEAAHAEGVALSDVQKAEIDSVMQTYRMSAAANYSMELTAYLQALYGPRMTESDMRAVLELETLANSFSMTVSDRLEAGITRAQALEYAEHNGLADTTPSRNIAYLFIPFEGGAVATQKVQSAYAALTQAPIADTLRTQAFGTYGEEENITPENGGVREINEWLFATGRAVGDYARIDTAGATYLAIYTGNGVTFAEVEARRALFDVAFVAWQGEWVERLTFGYNYDCLDSYDVD